MLSRNITVAFLLLVLPIAVAGACEVQFLLVDAAGKEIRIGTSSPVALDLGAVYTLRLSYREDHRNCTVPPTDTVFLIEGSRWRPGRETQPLVLSGTPVWTSSSRSNEGELRFTAAAAGTWDLEIIRTCDRGGYKGTIQFRVS